MEKNNYLLYIIIVILLILVLLFGGYTIYNYLNSNTQNTNNYLIDDVNDTVLGTYYNSDYNDIYFTLKSDGTADVVASTCSNGPQPLRNVAYKIIQENNETILEIDINNNQKYEDTYVRSIDKNKKYRFKPINYDCVEDANTYYEKN